MSQNFTIPKFKMYNIFVDQSPTKVCIDLLFTTDAVLANLTETTS